MRIDTLGISESVQMCKFPVSDYYRRRKVSLKIRSLPCKVVIVKENNLRRQILTLIEEKLACNFQYYKSQAITLHHHRVEPPKLSPVTMKFRTLDSLLGRLLELSLSSKHSWNSYSCIHISVARKVSLLWRTRRFFCSKSS